MFCSFAKPSLHHFHSDRRYPHRHPFEQGGFCQRRGHPFAHGYWSRPTPAAYQMDLEDLYNLLLTGIQFLSALATPENETQEQQTPSTENNGNKNEAEAVVPKATNWEVRLNVEGYKPEELNVKMIDNLVTISGNHEGIESRNFSKKWTIPENVMIEGMNCTFKDGNIVISAPWKVEVPSAPKEKLISINVERKEEEAKKNDGEIETTMEVENKTEKNETS